MAEWAFHEGLGLTLFAVIELSSGGEQDPQAEEVLAEEEMLAEEALTEAESIETAAQTDCPLHGNDAASTKPQHEYEIFKTENNDVVKNGISGQPLNQNGTSPRANPQVNKWNSEDGAGTYDARVVNQDIATRQQALDAEAARSQALRDAGHSMDKHKRP
jgi:hypothetical protein